MATRQVTLTASGTSAPIPIDLKQFMFGVGLLVTYGSTTTGTVTVQVSGDIPEAPISAWNSHDVLVSLTTSKNSSLAYPCSMVRLYVTGLASTTSATPSVTLSVIQAGT